MSEKDARADAVIRELLDREENRLKSWCVSGMGFCFGALAVTAGLGGFEGVDLPGAQGLFLRIVTLVGPYGVAGVMSVAGTMNLMTAGILGIRARRATKRAKHEVEAMCKERKLDSRSLDQRFDDAEGSMEIKKIAKKMLDENIHTHEPPRPFPQERKEENIKVDTAAGEAKVDSVPESAVSDLNALPNAETTVSKIKTRHALEAQRVLLGNGAIKPPGRGRMRA